MKYVLTTPLVAAIPFDVTLTTSLSSCDVTALGVVLPRMCLSLHDLRCVLRTAATDRSSVMFNLAGVMVDGFRACVVAVVGFDTGPFAVTVALPFDASLPSTVSQGSGTAR